MVVLITGANGQLGQALFSIERNYPSIDFVFCNSKELDITNKENCKQVFEKHNPSFCINAAAYTAVDKAETEPDKAFEINANGAENIAEICKTYNTILLHISTDFVFDAYYSKSTAYYDKELRLPLKSNLGLTETDVPFPSGIYGLTKLQGEQVVQHLWKKHFIIRTSWLYSEFGTNFMKTMLRLATERDTLSVVNDQIGTPTYAVDLAEALITIMLFCTSRNDWDNFYGIYNFSNEGQCSWYDFAKEIFNEKDIKINLHSIPTTSYSTPAKRPQYSVLDKTKIKEVFALNIQNWKRSLQDCLQKV
ncbi:dTDP-4-dehydrorhamnose reductase [Flavobacterium sp. 9AF]|uniref:dTDP-4-dehydrorhamnose reductase n=1 Tax=Flavobacterium sp. 9AF TaxID=2653142 RepID=UPI0012EF0C15|nr:dTDP-4-dehydrorhamnose reductase [Flavobacterium sp. 9AF]VXC10787.1 dTDP-4-dehydrorhamnose reductase [Flavobacterium sp. 9AF]